MMSKSDFPFQQSTITRDGWNWEECASGRRFGGRSAKRSWRSSSKLPKDFRDRVEILQPEPQRWPGKRGRTRPPGPSRQIQQSSKWWLASGILQNRKGDGVGTTIAVVKGDGDSRLDIRKTAQIAGHILQRDDAINSGEENAFALRSLRE